jgi:flagellar assembly factor FliW
MTAAMESQTSLTTTRFGEVPFDPAEIVEFPWGVPGFANLRRFVALAIADQPDFIWFQSVEDAAVALPAADPWVWFAQYEPRLPAYAIAALELDEPDDYTVLCVVDPGSDATEMTMNLLAPIVVNLKTRKARQIMLEGSRYGVRAPVPRALTAESV